MRLDQLRYFVEVANCNSLNKAAQNLFVTQSALTQSINNLEQVMGFKLLQRTVTGTHLTYFGEVVYQDCQEIFRLLDDKQEQWTRYASKQQKGSEISIGIVAVPVLCDNIVGELIGELAIDHPEMELILYEAIGLEVLNVMSKRARIGVAYDLSSGNERIINYAKKYDLQIIPVLEDEYHFFVASDHPLLLQEKVTLENLRDWTLIDKSAKNASASELLPSDYISLPQYFNRVIGTPNTDVMMNLVLAKKAVTMLPKYATARKMLRKNKLVVALPQIGLERPISFYIICPKRMSDGEKIVVDYIACHMKKLKETYEEKT